MSVETSVTGTTDNRETTIRDTSKDTGLMADLLLANLTGRSAGDPMSQLITGQEAQGQREFVHSTQLPSQAHNSDAEFEALGIVLGEPDPRDPLFRPATLPPGWERQGTDHNMWSDVVDPFGRPRIKVFYKAAFYDRRADMHIVTHVEYLRTCLWNKVPPVLDDQWLTADTTADVLAELADEAQSEAVKADGYAETHDRDYWTGRAAEHRDEKAQIEALIVQIRGGAR